MTRWIRILLAMGCLAFGPYCRGGRGHHGEGSRPEEQVGGWRVDSGGVGDLRLGQALPQSLGGRELGAHYWLAYVADGQPAEGFQFETPPLIAVLDSGPFTRAARGELVAPEPAMYRAQAVEETRAGAEVAMILVMGPGPVTAAGVGVGSTLVLLQEAYPNLALGAVPPTLGGDECVATTATLPHVHFLFASCETARVGGSVVRIDIWREAVAE